MSVNIETMIIGAIVHLRDLESARKEGLSPMHFGLEREKWAYEWLLNYAKENDGSVPPTDVFLKRSGFDDFIEPYQGFSIKGIAKEVIRNSKIRKVEQLFAEPEEIQEDPDGVLRDLLSTGREILRTHGGSKAVSLRDGLARVKDKMGSLRPGLPYPWPEFTKKSLGIQPGELVVLYGRPGCMKTWTLCSMATHLLRKKRKLKLLYYSVEPTMSSDRVYERIASLLLEIPFGRIRSRSLSEEEQVSLELAVDALSNAAPGMSSVYGSLQVVAPESRDFNELLRYVDEHEPDVLLIDSAYLLQPDPKLPPRDPKSLERTCRELTGLAQDQNLPIIITVQARRAKSDAVGPGGGDDVAYSDVLSQDSDVLLRLYPFIDDDEQKRLLVVVVKARDFDVGGVVIEPPPQDASYRELQILLNAAVVDLTLAKISNKGKKSRKASGPDTKNYLDQKGPMGAGGGTQ